MICSNFRGLLFKDSVTTSKRNIYNLMRSIDTYERNHNIVNEDASSYCGIPMPSNST